MREIFSLAVACMVALLPLLGGLEKTSPLSDRPISRESAHDVRKNAEPDDLSPVCGDGRCTVFITSETYSGDLGGLAGADAKCETLARNAGFSGRYKAWLSNGIASPSRRFTRAAVPYVLVDGTEIASNWLDLTDGTLTQHIHLTEKRSKPEGPSVWSATRFDGSPAEKDFHCRGWTSGLTTIGQGVTGTAGGPDTRYWSEYELQDCGNELALYCFEQ